MFRLEGAYTVMNQLNTFLEIRLSSRRLIIALSMLVLASVSSLLCFHGQKWSTNRHPDESVICQWANTSSQSPYIKTRVYPEGFFQLYRLGNLLKKPFDEFSRWGERWCNQRSASADGEEGNSDDAAETSNLESIAFLIRRTNALYAAAASIFFFLAALLIFNRIWIALCAALIFASHPFIVEHMHYAETEGAMLATLSLSLWLQMLAWKNKNRALLAIAAFSSGFAFATKFSLFTLCAPVLFIAAFLPCKGVRRLSRIGGISVALLLFFCGFLAGTPLLLLNPALFFLNLSNTSSRTYGEWHGVLREFSGLRFPRLLLTGSQLRDEAVKFGLFWWIWVFFGIALCFLRKYRRNLAVIPLFTLVYILSVVTMFPWFREQEFIPILPFVAIMTLFPFQFLADGGWRRLGRTRPVCLVACLVATLVILVFNATNGIRMANAFVLPEIRDVAGNWLFLCGPGGRILRHESYASPGKIPLIRQRISPSMLQKKVAKMESFTAEEWDCQGIDYFIRTPDRRGRLYFDPRTGKRFPRYQKNFDDIMERTFRIRSWSVEQDNRPKFAQVGIELYGARKPDEPAVPEPVSLSAPFYLHSRHFHSWPMLVSPEPPSFGPLEALHVTGRKSEILLTPLSAGMRYYAVVIHLVGNEDATVSWTRGFSPASRTLPPGGACLFTSTDGLPRLFQPLYSSRVKMRGNDQTSFCIAIFTTDPLQAASLLSEYGNTEEGERLRAKYAQEIPLRRSIPLRALDDFSRVHIFTPKLLPGNDKKERFYTTRRGFLYLETPVVLRSGEYTVTIAFSGSFPDTFEGIGLPSFDASGATMESVRFLGSDSIGNRLVELRISTADSRLPFCPGIQSVDGPWNQGVSYVVIQWSRQNDGSIAGEAHEDQEQHP